MIWLSATSINDLMKRIETVGKEEIQGLLEEWLDMVYKSVERIQVNDCTTVPYLLNIGSRQPRDSPENDDRPEINGDDDMIFVSSPASKRRKNIMNLRL